MTKYVPISNEANAFALSDALFTLSVPHYLQPEDGIQNAFSVIKASNGSSWLVVPTEYELNIHPESSFEPIKNILQEWINAGKLPKDTNENLQSFIESKKGGRIVVWDAFPSLFKDASKSYDDMIAEKLITMPS